MSLEDDVLALLRTEGRPLDDDEIAQRLGANRHYINAVSRKLAERGRIARVDGPSGKLVNKAFGAGSLPVPAAQIRERGRRAKVNPNERVESLLEDFEEAVAHFENSNAFPGPSLYFHNKAIERRRAHASFATLADDELFFEYVYAMLPAWGMHRMGKAAAKVGDFDLMVGSFRDRAAQIENLFHLRLGDLPSTQVGACGEALWRIIAQLKVSTSESRMVAGSKALHHVLPDLIPPLDRRYTWRFFSGQTSLSKGGEETAFLKWFPYLALVAEKKRETIAEVLKRGGPMATGVGKVVDNAIMGYMQMLGMEEDPSEEA